MAIPFEFADRLRVPLIVAPMFLVSCPRLAVASCRAGVIGSYPAHSTRTREVFAEWLAETEAGLAAAEAAGERPAPYAVNLVVHKTNPRMAGDLELCIEKFILSLTGCVIKETRLERLMSDTKICKTDKEFEIFKDSGVRFNASGQNDLLIASNHLFTVV